MKDPHCLRSEIIFPKCPDNPDLTVKGQKTQAGGGTDDESVTSSQERPRSSPPPFSSFDYKNVTHSVLGAEECLPTRL